MNVIYSNLWLFGTPMSWILSLQPSTNALVRTMTAVTLISGGFKENVLPSSASATLNCRIHPYQSVNDVVNVVRSTIKDERVKVSAQPHALEPHPISDFSDTSFAFNIITNSLLSVFPDVVVVPATMVGATDTKAYLRFTKNVYRIAPEVLTLEETGLIHGNDERISIENYMQIIEYYVNVIVRANE